MIAFCQARVSRRWWDFPIIVIGLFALQGGLEFIRSRVLSNIGAGLDEIFGNRVYNAILRLPLVTKTNGDGLQPLRDLDQVRTFMGSAGPTALFDLPWMPLYLIISFMFHFWIGMTALIGCTILVALTFTAERMTKEPARNSTTLLAARNALTEFDPPQRGSHSGHGNGQPARGSLVIDPSRPFGR